MHFAKRNKKISRIISAGLIFCLAFSLILPKEAFAGRSRAGGGKVAKFSAGDFALSVGVILGSMAIGSAVNAGVSNLSQEAAKAPSFLSAATNSLTKSFEFSNMASNFGTFAATSQIGKAVGMAGSYYGWSPSNTYLISGIATGAVGGFLNPGIALAGGGSMAKGALVGGLTGLASSGALVAIDGGKINQGKEPGIGAQIAGMTAGVAAGNFSRQLANLDPANKKAVAIMGREELDESAVLADYYGYEPPSQYSRVTAVGPSGIKEMPISESMAKGYAGPDYEWNSLSRKYVAAIQKDAPLTTGRLAQAAFVKTADMWPQLAARSLSIAVSSSGWAKENKSLASLATSAIEGLSGPLFNNLAEYYALRPSMYIGEEGMVKKIGHIERMASAAASANLGALGRDTSVTLAPYKGKKLDEKTQKLYEEKLDKDFAKQKIIFNDMTLDKILADTRSQLDKYVGKDSQKENEAQPHYKRLEELETQLKKEYSPELVRNIKMSYASAILSTRVKNYMLEGKTMDEIFREMGVSRASLLFNSTAKDIKYGLVEGAISGGAQALFSNLANNNSALSVAATGYGVTLVSGALRGVLWNKNWEESRQNKELVWMDRWNLYAPQYHTGDDWWERKINESTYRMQKDEFERFADVSKLKLVKAKKDTSSDKEDVFGYELKFKDKPPDLQTAVLASVAQSNYEFLSRSLAFERPRTKPENIDSLTALDYFRRLHSYGMSANTPGWLGRGFTSGMINAGSQAISNNILTSMAAVKPVAELFNIQRQRLVFTDGEFKGINPNPLIIQNLDYKPLGLETKFYLPWPNESYRARSVTDRSFLRDSNGK